MTIDRRQMLAGGLALAAARVVARGTASSSAPMINHHLPDVVVVGAGAFGGWTALELRERGARVTLVDAYGPGNPHASSGGESRNIQFAYGDKEIYVRWAVEAWRLWHQRQEEFGRRLVFDSGSLRARPPSVLDVDVAVFNKLKLPYEMLSPREATYRWPQLRYDDVEAIFYEKHSGIMKARESMTAVSEVFLHKGGELKLGYATLGAASRGRLDTIIVNGGSLSAGQFVFACGPWLPQLFPALLGDRIKVPRRELFFVGPARDDQRYRWEYCPTLSDATLYTSSDIGGGVKIAPSLRGVPMDPDDGERLATPFLKHQVDSYLARRIPGLVGRPVLTTQVCQLERTDNDDYIIDIHPDYANALIAGGGSGHGFKMGPKLGQYLADIALGRVQSPELQAVFGLAAHRAVPAGAGW
jgi:glycine/D-amino acid oxidase-like deaminating enzyme